MYIIIPSYEPDERLVQLVENLQEKSMANLLVVNDGSGPFYQPFFNDIKALGITVLEHETNKGKGAALKTAFSYLENKVTSDDVIVTADSDGQHLLEDIMKVAHTVSDTENTIVLGARAFVGRVPLRSRLGNKVTAFLFRCATKQPVTDTQTGLRGVKASLIPWLLKLEGDRFEYEFNMLLDAKKSGITLLEEPIETVYLEENKSSHFRPIKDSLMIYKPFLKFSGASVVAALTDLFFLFLLMAVTKNLFLSVVVSRVISASLQYFLNANVVFKKNAEPLKSMIYYFFLVITMLTFNYFLLDMLVSMGLALALAKLLTEALLFVIGYGIQRKVIFVS